MTFIGKRPRSGLQLHIELVVKYSKLIIICWVYAGKAFANKVFMSPVKWLGHVDINRKTIKLERQKIPYAHMRCSCDEIGSENRSNVKMKFQFVSRLFEGNSRAAIGFLVYMLILPFFWSNFSFLILVAFVAGSKVPQTSFIKDKPSSLCLALVFFVAVFGISIILSNSIWMSLRFSSAWPSGLLIYFIVSTHFDYEKDWDLFCISFSLSALLASLLCAFSFYSSTEIAITDTMSAIRSPLFVVPNDTIFLSLITPFSFSLIIRNRNVYISLLAGLSILFSIFTVIAFESRTALAVIFICAIFYSWDFQFRKIIKYMMVVGGSALLIDAILGFPIIQKLPLIPSSRIPLWHAALTMFREHPFFGGGPFTFGPYYQEFLQEITYPSWIIVDTRIIPWPHNLYLELLSGTGLVGLLAFLALFLAFHRKLYVLRKVVGFNRPIMRALLSISIGFIVASLVETTFLRIWVLVLFFALIGYVENVSSTTMRK